MIILHVFILVCPVHIHIIYFKHYFTVSVNLYGAASTALKNEKIL